MQTTFGSIGMEMAELLVQFVEPTQSESGDLYWGRVLGRLADDGLWEGWLEFTAAKGGNVVRTARETEQPNRDDLLYWAEGLTSTYLQGALTRALSPAVRATPVRERVLMRSAPRDNTAYVPTGSVATQARVVLDPFLTYAEGEDLLRRQLNALSHDHLANIIDAYQMNNGSPSDWIRVAPDDVLAEHIIRKVRERLRPAP